MLGVDDLQEYKLTVPANSLVLCHQDLFHRGTRALVETAPWRPMFGIRNLVRVSDPVAPTWAEDDADQPTVGAFAHTGAPRATQTIYEEMYSYMRGESAAPPRAAERAGELQMPVRRR